MRMLIVKAATFVLLATSGCSSVPGDAALRGGHPDQAADLYRLDAEQGNSSAALNLGLLIDKGRVSASKYGEAGKWFKKACSLSEITACHNVGVAYEYGKNGLNKDFALARNFYLKAADAGYLQSQYNLASLYSNGYITPSDDVEGMKWMLVARLTAEKCKHQQVCQWVLEDPPGHKQRLESRLTISQKEKAQSLASQWKVKQ